MTPSETYVSRIERAGRRVLQARSVRVDYDPSRSLWIARVTRRGTTETYRVSFEIGGIAFDPDTSR